MTDTNETNPDHGTKPNGVMGRILYSIFGESEYCEHGRTAWDGVCPECCNAIEQESS